MSDHAKLSPSKRSRWALCPGSIREEVKYPDTGSGPAAADGTHSHTLLEHCIKTGLSDPMDQVGDVFSDHEGTFLWTECFVGTHHVVDQTLAVTERCTTGNRCWRRHHE